MNFLPHTVLIFFADPPRDLNRNCVDRHVINKQPSHQPRRHFQQRNRNKIRNEQSMDRERWASLKDLIRHLYIEQNLNCKEVATILREQHDDRVRYVSRSLDDQLAN